MRHLVFLGQNYACLALRRKKRVATACFHDTEVTRFRRIFAVKTRST
jgi:hypothetical protein